MSEPAMPTLVRLNVSLKIQPNDGPVFFKVDGQRFGQNRTIKLLTGAKYKIEVVAKPGGIQATTMGIGAVTFPLEEKSRDAQMVVYSGIYDTEGVPHTKSGERQPIQVTMQSVSDESWKRLMLSGLGRVSWKICAVLENLDAVELTNIGTFETVWQVKFYNYHKRDHCQWGNSFASIEYECKPNETRTLLWINKESFH